MLLCVVGGIQWLTQQDLIGEGRSMFMHDWLCKTLLVEWNTLSDLQEGLYDDRVQLGKVVLTGEEGGLNGMTEL